MIETDVVIIGAGLAGLTLHYYLKKYNISACTIEARNRLGGRILTDDVEGKAPVELGATWLGENHRHLRTLLEELKVDTFPQIYGDRAIYEPISTSPPQLVQLPPNNSPSYRIAGGTSKIIEALAKNISDQHILLGEPVSKITDLGDLLLIKGKDQSYKAKIVVSTLPPKLFKEHVRVEPQLPKELLDLMELTHTWMSTSIKIGLKYPTPFWRSDQLSGTIFSNVGPISELYDHSDKEDEQYALKGFLNNVYHVVSKEERKNIVLNQLQKYYGPQIAENLDYIDKDWSKEVYTHSTYSSHILPHQNNGHSLYQRPFMKGKLFFGGTETAEIHPGYMEGAVYRSVSLLDQIKNCLTLV